MLKIPELAMKPTRTVKTKCYGQVRPWSDSEEAEDFFLEAMMNTEGAEHDHYTAIYIQLVNGLNYCTDED